MPHRILVINRVAKRRVDGRGFGSAKDSGKHSFHQFRFARFGEVYSIKRQWLSLSRSLGEKLAGGREEVDEGHAFTVASNFSHRCRVERKVGVVFRWNLEVGIGVIFVRDGRKQND